MNVDYDIKDLMQKITTEDISQIHDWINWYEKNEFLRKKKLFRNMTDKLNFYKKLEIPQLQDAYNRLINFLRQNDRLAEKGEFSMLNVS